MKIVVIATLFAGLTAFANPGTPAAGTAAPAGKVETTGTMGAGKSGTTPAGHDKMGHAGKAGHATECKEKNADGSCKTEMKK